MQTLITCVHTYSIAMSTSKKLDEYMHTHPYKHEDTHPIPIRTPEIFPMNVYTHILSLSTFRRLEHHVLLLTGTLPVIKIIIRYNCEYLCQI